MPVNMMLSSDSRAATQPKIESDKFFECLTRFNVVEYHWTLLRTARLSRLRRKASFSRTFHWLLTYATARLLHHELLPSCLRMTRQKDHREGEAHQVLIEDAPIDLVPEDRFDQILGDAIQPLSRSLRVFPLRSQISQSNHIPSWYPNSRGLSSWQSGARLSTNHMISFAFTVHTEPHFGGASFV